jgi:hypothetical protein
MLANHELFSAGLKRAEATIKAFGAVIAPRRRYSSSTLARSSARKMLSFAIAKTRARTSIGSDGL